MKLNICISLNPPTTLKVGMVEKNEAQKRKMPCPVSMDNKIYYPNELYEKFCLSELKT